MAEYLPRAVDAELDELLAVLPAISLAGPKGVGKTATARRRAATVFAVDDPVQRELLRADPSALDAGRSPILIDEWQRLPETWDRVRRAVDDGAGPGSFLLTGSATPSDAPTHSGAGRIVTLRLRPMSLAERGPDRPAVSLRRMLSGDRTDIAGRTATALADYAAAIVESGLPGIRRLSGRARRVTLDGYLDRIVEHDFPEQGYFVRRPTTLQAWLRAYAAATATTTSYTSILDAATAGYADKPAKTTTIAYRDVLSQLWLLDPVPAWAAEGSAFARLARQPKHHLADPALAARLLDLDADDLRTGKRGRVPSPQPGPMLGQLFESLVTLDVRVYAQAAEATVHHLRTTNGDHEIDLLVEGPDGSVVGLEVKLAPAVGDADVRHLHWLRSRLGDRCADLAVITTGPFAYRRPDGIAVVPAALLGP